MRRSLLILALLYAAAIGQLAWYAPRMPAVMATHYDGAGTPNGWMTRAGALGFHLTILGVSALAFALPMLLLRLAPSLINLPNRQYWLAPDRRAATTATLQSLFSAMGCGMVLFLIAVTALNFHANLNPPARLSSPLLVALIFGFLLYVGGWTVAFYRRFRRPSGVQRT
ncbi:MAG: DUF1648 domain-containing protein [Planctomycetes bacterium]|nr:DUF1648 domain-containing protein [Planctomycetota bacterium]